MGENGRICVVSEAEPKLTKIVKQFMTEFKETVKLGGHKYLLNDVLFNRLLDILSPRSRKTTLMAHYTGVDGKPKYVQNQNPKLGNVIKNESNRHAEKVFIDEYLAAITSVATEYNLRTGKKSSLYITMNRSSCDAIPHDCTGQLVEQIRNYENILSVHIEFASAYASGNEYLAKWPDKELAPKAKERVEKVVTRLIEAGANVYATTLWREIQKTAYFKRFNPRTRAARNATQYAVLERIFHEIVTDAYSKSSKGNEEQA